MTTRRIEDYAFLSDTESCALVGRDGSIDWLTFPRFDSPACFAALLGTDDNGHWTLCPAGPVRNVERRYRPGTLVLETTFRTDEGEVVVVDAMPIRADSRLDVVRRVEGRSGRVPMRMVLSARFDYGSIVPRVLATDRGATVVAGPDALNLSTPVPITIDEGEVSASFVVAEGDAVAFDLAWNRSHDEPPASTDVARAIEDTTRWWRDWSSRCHRFGKYDECIATSLTVLKGLTYAPTGGIVAAATTSLPEVIGGQRNWDYRYCWLRDATFTLLSLIEAGFTDEAVAWRDWLLRAVAGQPEDVQIMYGPAGERRLTELTLDWLEGFAGSTPVRIGNGAHGQFQLDVIGEVLDVLFEGERAELFHGPDTVELAGSLVEVAMDRWREPDDGIWEVRSGRDHFTHSKVMAWVALDRAVRLAERTGCSYETRDLNELRASREEIRAQVLAHGVDERGVLVQTFGGSALDASLLMVPLVGFLPGNDPRVVATVEAIQRELTHDGFVHRYDTDAVDDGVGGPEGTFVMCTLWLVDALVLMDRRTEAEALFERVLALRNDVGLLAEMWDPAAGRQLGNLPQAFSHTALATSAMALSPRGPRAARHR